MTTPQTVEIVVENSVTNEPIAGVLVTVRDSASRLYASGQTDAEGAYTLTDVEPGSYGVVAESANYTYDDDVIEVEDVEGVGENPPPTQSFTSSLTPLITPPTSLPGKCLVYGFVDSQPGDRVLVTVEALKTDSILRTEPGEGVSDANLFVVEQSWTELVRNGQWQTRLIVGAMYRIRIQAMNWEKTFVVPDSASLSVADILAYPTATPPGQVGA